MERERREGKRREESSINERSLLANTAQLTRGKGGERGDPNYLNLSKCIAIDHWRHPEGAPQLLCPRFETVEERRRMTRKEKE